LSIISGKTLLKNRRALLSGYRPETPAISEKPGGPHREKAFIARPAVAHDTANAGGSTAIANARRSDAGQLLHVTLLSLAMHAG